MKVRELPAYYTAQDALAPDAVQLHAKKPGNIERDVLFELGNVAEGFAQADLVREAPTTAPRSARTRWRCTPRSPTTTPCATA